MDTWLGERKILVIGAGISGLSAAIRIAKEFPTASVTICDGRPEAGGVLQTRYANDGLVELSADMFTTKLPWALRLCEMIGYQNQLIPTDEKRRGALLATRTGTSPVPTGFSLMIPNQLSGILRSPLLGISGKLRVLLEPLFATVNRKFYPGGSFDESLQDFAIRHWGRQVFDRLIQPLVSGIYTADPAKLSMQAALSEFADMEKNYGSLLLGRRHAEKSKHAQGADARPSTAHPQGASNAVAAAEEKADSIGGASQALSEASQKASGARYGLFLTPKNGMQDWIQAMVQWLKDQSVEFRMGVKAVDLKSTAGGWQVALENVDDAASSADDDRVPPKQRQVQVFDAVVVATPSWQAADLLKQVDPMVATLLSQIEFASAAIVISRFKKTQFPNDGRDLGFGMVVPSYLKSPLIATSFSSNKFSGRCDDDSLVTRSFLGGALNPEVIGWTDEEIIDASLMQFRRWIPFQGQPEFSEVIRWSRAMPQYHLGHVQKVESIDHQMNGLNRIALAGNAYKGVGIPQCIKSGWDAADKLIVELKPSSSGQ